MKFERGLKMKLLIRKREYAKGKLPWCPYVGGFWKNLKEGHLSALCWMGYRIEFWR